MTYPGLALIVCAATATALSCSDDGGDGPKDCKVVAAFDLTLRAAGGPLPPDTTVEVQYGGGVESYRVDAGMQSQEVVLCDDDAPETGVGGVTVVHCKLWTQGAATVKVTASGFPPVEQTLEAKAQGKCIQTVPVEIVLGDQDAGP
jgi:hypothetical protein